MHVIDPNAPLLHSGVKGMKWGVRKARQSVQADNKNARQIVKSYNKAKTPEQKKAAADRYKKEVLDNIRSKDFRDKFNAATTLRKGDMAINTLLTGPFGAHIIKKEMAFDNAHGVDVNIATASQVLREMRAGSSTVRPTSTYVNARREAKANA